MRKYEMVYILRPDMDEAATEAAIAKVNDTIANNAGTLEQEDKWGLKKLAYEINDYREGYYVVATFNGNIDTVKSLDYLAKVSDTMLRHMVIRIDE